MGKLMKFQISEILKRYANGETTTELGKEFKVSRTAISGHIRRSRIEHKDGRLKLTNHQKKEIVRLYKEEFVALRDLAVKFDVHIQTIRRYLRHEGIKLSDSQKHKRWQKNNSARWNKLNTEKCKRYRHKHPEIYKRQYQLRYTKDLKSWLTYILKTAKGSAKKYNREFKITVDYLEKLYNKQGQVCNISGMKMETSMYNLRAISLDRIDRDKGYIPENVQLICKWVNIGKGGHPDEEMKNIIEELKQGNLLDL